jgi:hypothetical protein
MSTAITTHDSTDKNMDFVMNHKYFITGLVSITDMLKEISEKVVNTNNKIRHVKLQICCDKILRQYRGNENILDEGKIIKKIYKTLKANASLLLEKDSKLFTIRDDNNRIVTVIPGLDIGLVYEHFDNEQRVYFWQFMYLTFISSYKMVTSANKDKIISDEQVLKDINTIESELRKTGLTINGNIFNPFVGLNDTDNSDKQFGIDDLYSGVDAPHMEDISIEFVLKQLGITDMIDMDKVNEQLQNITDEDIVELKKNMSNLLGGDQTVTNTCNTMVDKIVDNIREHGIHDMMGLVQSMSEDITSTMNKDDLLETGKVMNSFMKDSESKIKDMTDENGNNIGGKLSEMMDKFRGFNGGNFDDNVE